MDSLSKIKVNKKGQVNTLTASILAIVIASLILVFTIIIQQNLRDTNLLRKVPGVVTNETGAFINATIYRVTNNGARIFADFSITQARNGTNGAVISSANYTTFANNGTVINNTNVQWNNVHLDYSYTYGGEAFDTANETLVANGTFADFFPMIILAVIVGIILGILLGVFGGKPR